MTEKINRGDSFYKDVFVTQFDGDEEYPVDLSPYDDNYISIKKDRGTPDDEAYIFKQVYSAIPTEGVLVIDLTPEETMLLPETSIDTIQSIEGFVQIGSTITGRVHEVSSFKIKTRLGGIGHITEIDKSYDMGCITEEVGWAFDAGKLCEQTTSVINFDDKNNGVLMYNAGSMLATELEIIDFGVLNLEMPDVVDMGQLRECSGLELCRA